MVKDPPAPEQTAGMLVGRIRGGNALRWVEDHADVEKLGKADGEAYVLKELATLYEKSVPEKVLAAWADVTTISLTETRKNKPPEENEYEHFLREYKARLQRLRTIALGTAATAQAIPELIQAINALWRLGLEPREQTRLISFMNDDVKKDLFKLTMPELERVVRLALSQNRELTKLFGRGRRSERQQA